MKSSHIRACDMEEQWFLYDASKHVLGRMAVDIAVRLMGKDDPRYTPSELGRSHVVVVQAERAQLTGTKEQAKQYRRYTGYAGGLRLRSLETVRERKPEDIVRLAVKRMLPKTNLGRRMLSKLKVYRGTEHPHAAQKPVKVEQLSS